MLNHRYWSNVWTRMKMLLKLNQRLLNYIQRMVWKFSLDKIPNWSLKL